MCKRNFTDERKIPGNGVVFKLRFIFQFSFCFLQKEYLIKVITYLYVCNDLVSFCTILTYLFYLVCCCHSVEKSCKCFRKSGCNRNGQSCIEILFTYIYIYLFVLMAWMCNLAYPVGIPHFVFQFVVTKKM